MPQRLIKTVKKQVPTDFDPSTDKPKSTTEYDPKKDQYTRTTTFHPGTDKPDIVIDYNPDGTVKEIVHYNKEGNIVKRSTPSSPNTK